MKRPKKNKRVVPQAGGEAFHEGEPAPLTYSMPMPPVKSRGRLVPIQDDPVVDLGEPRYHTPVGPAKSVVRPTPADAVAVTDAGEPLLADKADNCSLVPASEE